MCRRDLAVQDMKIGAADTAGADLDQHPALRRRFPVSCFRCKSRTWPWQDHGVARNAGKQAGNRRGQGWRRQLR